jgi:multidrug resistance efflux pump
MKKEENRDSRMLNISSCYAKISNKQDDMFVFSMLHSNIFGRIIAYCILGMIVVVTICLFLPWQQNIRGYGHVTAFSPKDRPQDLNVTVGGKISEWYVNEGQYVQKGDPIALLTEIKDYFFDPMLSSRMEKQLVSMLEGLEAYNQKVLALDQQYAALRDGMDVSLSQASNKIVQLKYKIKIDSADLEAVSQQYAVAEQQFSREQQLFTKGLTSLTELENKRIKFQEMSAKKNSAENKLASSKNEMLNAQLEINLKRADYTDKFSKSLSEKNSTLAALNDAEIKIYKMETEIANVKTRQDYYLVRAPQDGYIIKSVKSGIGEIVKEGESIITIMPSKPQLAVELYVTANDLPLVKIGTKMRLQFDGYPAMVFSGWPNVSIGTFGGEVRVVDLVASFENKYRVLVIPQKKETWPEMIRIGSGVYGWAMLSEVPIWYEIWRQLNAFPPIYQGEPMSGTVNAGKEDGGKSEKTKKEK